MQKIIKVTGKGKSRKIVITKGRAKITTKYTQYKHRTLKTLLGKKPGISAREIRQFISRKILFARAKYTIAHETAKKRKYTVIRGPDMNILWKTHGTGKKKYHDALEKLKKIRATEITRRIREKIPAKKPAPAKPTAPPTTEPHVYRSSLVYSYTSRSNDIIDLRAWTHTRDPADYNQVRETLMAMLEHMVAEIPKSKSGTGLGNYLQETSFEHNALIPETEIDPPDAQPGEVHGYIQFGKKNASTYKYRMSADRGIQEY